MNSDGISYHFYSKIAIKNLMNSQLKGPLSIHTTHFYFQTTDLGNLDDGVSSGLEILQKLTHYLICPSFQSQISWTGRGKGKERKFALNSCTHLVNFLVVTVNKIHSKYTYKKVVNELTYNILKRAATNPKACNFSPLPMESNGNEADANSVISVSMPSPPSTSSSDASRLTSISTKMPSPPLTQPDVSDCGSITISETPDRPKQVYSQSNFPQSGDISSIQQRSLPPLSYWDPRFLRELPPYSYPRF